MYRFFLTFLSPNVVLYQLVFVYVVSVEVLFTFVLVDMFI